MRSSFPLTFEHDRIRVAGLRAAIAALVAVGLLALVAWSPTVAHAESGFTLQACEGSPIQGEGSSLQKVAQLSYWTTSEVFGSPLTPGCGASAPQVTYKSDSSGCGLDAMGAGDPSAGCTFQSNPSFEAEAKGYRDGTDRYGASDFAPSPVEQANIDNGPTGGAHAGKIHVIPVAGAAITVVVHFPDGCALQNPEQGGGNGNTSTGGPNDPSGKATGDKFSNQTLRVHISASKLEEIWEDHITTWGQIVPKADFLETAPEGVTKDQEECANTPIIRIVRFDTSGTTYNFKAYLSLLPSPGNDGGPALWTSGPVGANNTEWPIASVSNLEVPHTVNGSSECVEAVHICKAAAEGGGSLATAVEKTNGSIGYLDLATAREKHYDMTPNPSGEPGKVGFKETENDRFYWIPLQTINPTKGNEVGANYVEPTSDPTAHFNPIGGSTKGANCSGADYRGIPTTPSDPTLGDWSEAIATGGSTYPVCAITYDLAFDDDAPVYGNTQQEQEKARTVKDYLTAVVNNSGGLKAFDYATLPLALVQDAQNGVAAIGWNKSAGASSGNNGSSNSGGSSSSSSSTSTAAASTPITAVAPPSNVFSIASAKVKGKDIVLSLVLPDAGTVQIKATGGGVTVSSVSASVGGGQGTVTLPISSSALKKIAKSKSKKLAVTITVTFTPTGGTAASQVKQLTVTQAAINAKPKKKTKLKKKGKKKG
jgi:ABC-type phosphate transport system substrate-binding protein